MPTLGSLFSSVGLDKVKAGTLPPEVGEQYQALINSNPYRNVEYKVSPWQNLLSALGFRTKADAWKENMAVQANEYDAAIQQKIYDESYNDPSKQVERMRAAGLNPDIDGGSTISPGDAASLGEDPSTPMMSDGDEGLVLQVANGVLGAFSSAVGLIQSVQGIARNRLENSLLETQNESDFMSFVTGLAPMMLPESAHPDGIENFDWKAASLENARRYAGSLPKSMQDKFIQAQERFWSSAVGEGESYDAFKKRIESMRSHDIERQTFFSELPDVLTQITGPLAEMAEKIYSKRQSADLAEAGAAQAGAQTEIAYQSELNGELMAQAVNAENKSEKENNETIAILREGVNNVISGLKETSQEGGIKGGLASIALAGITGIYLWLSSIGMPSVSRSQNSGSWHTNRGFGSNSGSSFSIGW